MGLAISYPDLVLAMVNLLAMEYFFMWRCFVIYHLDNAYPKVSQTQKTIL